MTTSPSFFRLSRLGLVAAILLALCAGSARSQVPAQDCAVPSQLPNGPTPKSLSDCAMAHGLFLYAHRCVDGPDCAVENAPVVAAFKAASRIFDSYLNTRGQNVTSAQKANDNYKRGLLAEGAHEYSTAVYCYHRCQQLAKDSSSADLTRCSENYIRLKCLLDSSLSFCQSAGPGVTRTVIMTVTTQSGGSVASALDADQDSAPGAAAPTLSESLVISVKLPAKYEISQAQASMTSKERQDLAQAFKQQQLAVTPKPPSGQDEPANSK